MRALSREERCYHLAAQRLANLVPTWVSFGPRETVEQS